MGNDSIETLGGCEDYVFDDLLRRIMELETG